MARCAGVFAVELCYLRLCMQLHAFLPLVVTLVIALPFHKLLEPVVAHPAVQYVFDLLLVLAVNESWGWGWCRTSARDGIWMR
jgi:hypothetical protein